MVTNLPENVAEKLGCVDELPGAGVLPGVLTGVPLVVPAGMHNFWPMVSVYGSLRLLASAIAWTVVLYFKAMAERVSPDTTVYVAAQVAAWILAGCGSTVAKNANTKIRLIHITDSLEILELGFMEKTPYIFVTLSTIDNLLKSFLQPVMQLSVVCSSNSHFLTGWFKREFSANCLQAHSRILPGKRNYLYHTLSGRLAVEADGSMGVVYGS